MNPLTFPPAVPATATSAPPEPAPCPALETVPQQLARRQQVLAEVAAQLKTELFGIDDIIDRVIDAVRAWYVLPPLITRPVIVCLWGLTGTGKTQLTRRLAQLLGFYDRFIEVQMDGFSHGSNYRNSSISGMLGDSGIHEGEPGILVLDEFQRFRTVDKKGEDIKVERYQDVWTLLSDGRLPPSLSALGAIEQKIAGARYDAEREQDDDAPARADKPPRKFQLDAWDAQELKRMLKLRAPLMAIMQWPPAQIEALLLAFQQSHQDWETDYSKLLVFVCGNLDEMYRETASRVEDCDTDADIFHQLTRKLSLIDVKKALSQRFKPEQIARLGNLHVIYPSFSRATYERLIARLAGRYALDIARDVGVRLCIGQDVLEAVYQNAVFPAQGTRPLFSSVHAILSANLVRAALWALEQGIAPETVLQVALDESKRHLCVSAQTEQGVLRQRFAVALELSQLKQRANADFRALLAVHEAGHGLIYSLLFRRSPQEIKINIASFEGGYNSFSILKARTRQNCLDMICVGLAGRQAEALVFGEMACTTGAEQDYKQATEEAARYIRHYGFGERISRTDVTVDIDHHINTDIAPSNAAIEALLGEQQARTRDLLARHRQALTAMAGALQTHGLILKEDMATLMAAHGVALAPALEADEPLVLEPFAERLARFAQDGREKS